MKLRNTLLFLIVTLLGLGFELNGQESFEISFGDTQDQMVFGQTFTAKANSPFTAKIKYNGSGMGTMPDLKLMSVSFINPLGVGTGLIGSELFRKASEPDVQSPLSTEIDFEFCPDQPENPDFLLFDFDTECEFLLGPDTLDENNIRIETGLLELLQTTPGKYEIVLRASESIGPIRKATFTLNLIEEDSSIPTLSQWGLFLFILLITGLGLVTIYNVQLVGAHMKGNATLARSRFHFPVDWQQMRAVIPHAIGITIVGVAAIFLFWGELLSHDVIGLLIAFPLVTYILHITSLFKRKG